MSPAPVVVTTKAKLEPSQWRMAAGAFLILLAVVCSNRVMEAFFGRAPHSLAWGPALFRVLLALHGEALFASAFVRARKRRLSAEAPISRRSWWILGALTIVAIALRIPSLNSCLWLDEVITMARYARWPFARILTSFPDQNQHMLFSLLAHTSVLSFGEHAWAVRLPSVLLGVGSIWALFLLGRRLLGETEALLACALMAVSYHHIWFSQNARGYMGLLFFTNLSTWLWLKAMDRDSWPKWLGYSAAVALGMWIHMTMLFVMAAHALIFFVVWLRSGRDLARLGMAVAAFALCVTLSLQEIALALPEFLRTAASEYSPPSEWVNPLWVVRESLRSLQVGFAGSAVVLCGGLLVAAGWLDMHRREARAAWAMVLPAVLGGGSMLLLGHNLWPRFFFFCMGFALLIVIHGALQAPHILLLRDRKALYAGYALAGLIIAASLTTVPRVYGPKQDYTGARDFILSHKAAADKVIVAGLAMYAYTEYYAPMWPTAHDGAELADLRRGPGRSWMVYTLLPDLKSVHADIWSAVQSDFEVVRVFPGTLGSGEVFVARERQ